MQSTIPYVGNTTSLLPLVKELYEKVDNDIEVRIHFYSAGNDFTYARTT